MQKPEHATAAEHQCGATVTDVTAIEKIEFLLGGDDFIKQLLSQQLSADVDRLIRYHRYLGEQRLASMNRYKQGLEELEGVQSKLDSKLKEQTDRSQALVSQTNQLKTQRQERSQAIRALARLLLRLCSRMCSGALSL